MSKERARRRAEREREAAIRAAARAASDERRERQLARQRARRAALSRFTLSPVGRPTGTLARRRRLQNSMLAATLAAIVLLAWVMRPDWAARLGAIVVAVLAFPVIRLLLFSRR